MNKEEKNIIAYVMSIPNSVPKSIKALEKRQGKKYRLMAICDHKQLNMDKIHGHDILVTCDFSKPWRIAEALLPYQDQLLAISCRADLNIGWFRKVIPHVPYLRTPTTESLMWATDKYEMRKRFRLFNAKMTPKFTLVKENSKLERKRVGEKIGFPMIVKPTNLSGSLFVTICYHQEDLEKTLRTIFRKMRKAYEKDGRLEDPKVIAEQYMEGDLYSIDSYVNSRGTVLHCPLVRQKTARDIGHDDFYNYLQITPPILKKATVENAHEATEVAIHALGLRSTTVHTELMKMDDEWKIVEVGPRVGGVRDSLYELSCDIDHSLNDILIRMPIKPMIPKKCKGYAAYMKYFANKEGAIVETKGIKKIEELESFHSIVINKKVGDRSVFARNGGRSIFNAVLYNQDRSRLLADIRRIEQSVKVMVTNGRSSNVKITKLTKTILKKKVTK